MRRIRAYIINFQVFAKINNSSSTFTVPKGVKKIDVFCVGGGGAGGIQGGYMGIIPTGNGDEEYYTNIWGGGGGGGGYTNTMKNIAVTPGQQLSVVVGNGGMRYEFSGGDSSVAIDSGSTISASGGKAGYQSGGNMINCSYVESGSCGGSGGGKGSEYGTGCISSPSYNMLAPVSTFPTFDNGGKDGGNSGNFWRAGQSETAHQETIRIYNNFKGQGTTTRYFGESTGTLYSNGGSGGNLNLNFFGTAPSANTGGGGNGGPNGGINSSFSQFHVYNYGGSKGASGICIIRWGKQ